jgi:predicted CopG family antitoxin
MATKTITIDVEAYERLKSVQQKNESFSQTIKRIAPKIVPIDELIETFRNVGSKLSDDFFEGVEAALAARNSEADRERMNGLLGHNGAAGPSRKGRATKTSRRRGKTKAA